jgi:hypothetical protein
VFDEVIWEAVEPALLAPAHDEHVELRHPDRFKRFSRQRQRKSKLLRRLRRQEHDVELDCRIRVESFEWRSGDEALEPTNGPKHDDRFTADHIPQLPPNALEDSGRGVGRRLEDDVAALDVRAHTFAPGRGERRAQVGHLHEGVPGDVDRSQERDVLHRIGQPGESVLAVSR